MSVIRAIPKLFAGTAEAFPFRIHIVSEKSDTT